MVYLTLDIYLIFPAKNAGKTDKTGGTQYELFSKAALDR